MGEKDDLFVLFSSRITTIFIALFVLFFLVLLLLFFLCNAEFSYAVAGLWTRKQQRNEKISPLLLRLVGLHEASTQDDGGQDIRPEEELIEHVDEQVALVELQVFKVDPLDFELIFLQ